MQTPRSYGYGATGETVSDQKRNTSLRQKIRYRFDNSLSRGPGAFVGWLALLAFFISLGITLLRLIADRPTDGTAGPGFIDRLWNTLYILFIGGLGAAPVGTWPQRALSILFWATALTITATVIGFVAKVINERVERLKKGRSPIIESNHTLILGWSNRIFPILQQLSVANENVRKPLVVIFANQDREWMDDEIAARAGDLGHLRVVTRNGDVTNPADLARANVAEAKSIILLDADETGDAAIVSAVLAVRAVIGERRMPLVAELDDHHSAAALRHATRGQVLAVRSDEIIARVTAQASRQPGLAAVMLDLLDFEGDEIYFGSAADLVGSTYGDALLAFEKAAIIGLQKADGSIHINPDPATAIAAGDQLIAIAEDDDKVNFTGLRNDLKDVRAVQATSSGRSAEHILVIGWSYMGRMVMEELAQFLPKGSTVHIVSNPRLVHAHEFEGLTLGEIKVEHTSVGSDIQELVAVASKMHFDEVIVLGYRDNISVTEADAITLLTMLQMNQLFEEEGNGVDPTRLVAEILDSRKVELARFAAADDLVVSDSLSALMLAQLSENPDLGPVFDDLFDADGASVNVKPASGYQPVGTKTDFATLVAAARARSESAIGYRTIANAKNDPASGVVLNPAKSTLITVAEGDGLVVVGPAD